MTEVIWTPDARADLLDIYILIGVEQPAAAERYLDRIEQKAHLLARHPRIGVRRPDIRPAFRMMVEQPYLILYRTEPDTDDGPILVAEIVRIIDGRREISQLF
mgnify:CR=1 FL=1